MANPNVTQLRIRLKDGVLNWLRESALHNKRSLSGEIEYCAERYIESEENKKAEESELGGKNSSASKKLVKETNQ